MNLINQINRGRVSYPSTGLRVKKLRGLDARYFNDSRLIEYPENNL